jgi:hypothetical protein
MYIYIVMDYYLNAFYWICINANIEKRIDSRYDYMHIWLLTGFISRFYLFFISRFVFLFLFLHVSGQHWSKPLVLCWFENRSHEIKEPSWEPGGGLMRRREKEKKQP